MPYEQCLIVIMVIIQKAIDTTLENFKQFNRYEQFMDDATQAEFARSQIPFYFAVKAFPRALCYLASMIEESSVRLSLAENIWEEHGNGDAKSFHIHTFHQYLTAIAGENYALTHNPWIEKWIDGWFKSKDVHALACQLAAIEYLYAPISQKLAEYIATLSLNNEQGHYSKHAVLDWNHGRDLFEIALHYDDSENYEKTFELFSKAQEAFIAVFNGMVILTEKEVKSIAQDPIAFYYLREDGDVALRALQQLEDRESLNVMSICSGGENLLRYLQSSKAMNIIALDMNPNQYQLFENKLTAVLNDNNTEIFTELSQGKFERIFKKLRERFTQAERDQFAHTGNIAEDKLRFAVEDIFSRQNLSVIFTDNAVKYTQKDFAEHFCKVFLSEFDAGSFGEQNIRNILVGQTFDYNLHPLQMDNKSITPVIHYVNDVNIFDHVDLAKQNMDMIDLSNIGDWIEPSALRSVVQKAYQKLNEGGVLIIRKLLGDYDLKQVLTDVGFMAENDEDSCHFYEEVVIGHKHG